MERNQECQAACQAKLNAKEGPPHSDPPPPPSYQDRGYDTSQPRLYNDCYDYIYNPCYWQQPPMPDSYARCVHFSNASAKHDPS